MKRPADLLRKEYETLKTEMAARDKKIAEYEAKQKELEARGQDTEKLSAVIKQLEGERDQARAEARRARKEMDPAFVQKWQVPFDDAVLETEDLIAVMDITDPESGEVRKGSKDDVTRLYGIKSPTLRNAEIRKMFGDDAISIIPKFDRLQSINNNYKRALAQEQARAAELDKVEQGRAVQQSIERKQAEERLNKELVESVPEYRDAPEDTESAEARKKAYAVFDAKPANGQAQAIRDAHVRHIVGAFFPMKLKIGRLEAELAKAKAEIEALKAPDPNTPNKRSGGTPAAAHNLSWEEEARKELL